MLYVAYKPTTHSPKVTDQNIFYTYISRHGEKQNESDDESLHVVLLAV